MSEPSIDPQQWETLRHHLEEATRLLTLLRRKHEPILSYQQYSKLQVVETTVGKFAVDIAEVHRQLTHPGDEK